MSDAAAEYFAYGLIAAEPELAAKEKAEQWWKETMQKRLGKEGKKVVILSRLHEDDLAEIVPHVTEESWPYIHMDP